MSPKKKFLGRGMRTQGSANHKLASFPLLQRLALLLRSCEADVSVQSKGISELPMVITQPKTRTQITFLSTYCKKKPNHSRWGKRVTRYFKSGSSWTIGVNGDYG